MAESRCASSISKMEFLSSTLPTAVATAKEEIISGYLRNSRGTKVREEVLSLVHEIRTSLIVVVLRPRKIFKRLFFNSETLGGQR